MRHHHETGSTSAREDGGDVVRMRMKVPVSQELIDFLASYGYYFVPTAMPEYSLWLRGVLTTRDLLYKFADRSTGLTEE